MVVGLGLYRVKYDFRYTWWHIIKTKSARCLLNFRPNYSTGKNDTEKFRFICLALFFFNRNRIHFLQPANGPYWPAALINPLEVMSGRIFCKV